MFSFFIEKKKIQPLTEYGYDRMNLLSTVKRRKLKSSREATLAFTPEGVAFNIYFLLVCYQQTKNRNKNQKNWALPFSLQLRLLEFNFSFSLQLPLLQQP
ncbi:hypothetical protein Peur_057577 [Populus x canadensis]